MLNTSADFGPPFLLTLAAPVHFVADFQSIAFAIFNQAQTPAPTPKIDPLDPNRGVSKNSMDDYDPDDADSESAKDSELFPNETTTAVTNNDDETNKTNISMPINISNQAPHKLQHQSIVGQLPARRSSYRINLASGQTYQYCYMRTKQQSTSMATKENNTSFLNATGSMQKLDNFVPSEPELDRPEVKCEDDNTICELGACVCKQGFFLWANVCRPLRDLMLNCQDDLHCHALNVDFICNTKTLNEKPFCDCAPGNYFEPETHSCLPCIRSMIIMTKSISPAQAGPTSTKSNINSNLVNTTNSEISLDTSTMKSSQAEATSNHLHQSQLNLRKTSTLKSCLNNHNHHIGSTANAQSYLDPSRANIKLPPGTSYDQQMKEDTYSNYNNISNNNGSKQQVVALDENTAGPTTGSGMNSGIWFASSNPQLHGIWSSQPTSSISGLAPTQATTTTTHSNANHHLNSSDPFKIKTPLQVFMGAIMLFTMVTVAWFLLHRMIHDCRAIFKSIRQSGAQSHGTSSQINNCNNNFGFTFDAHRLALNNSQNHRNSNSLASCSILDDHGYNYANATSNLLPRAHYFATNSPETRAVARLLANENYSRHPYVTNLASSLYQRDLAGVIVQHLAANMSPSSTSQALEALNSGGMLTSTSGQTEAAPLANGLTSSTATSTATTTTIATSTAAIDNHTSIGHYPTASLGQQSPSSRSSAAAAAAAAQILLAPSHPAMTILRAVAANSAAAAAAAGQFSHYTSQGDYMMPNFFGPGQHSFGPAQVACLLDPPPKYEEAIASSATDDLEMTTTSVSPGAITAIIPGSVSGTNTTTTTTTSSSLTLSTTVANSPPPTSLSLPQDADSESTTSPVSSSPATTTNTTTITNLGPRTSFHTLQPYHSLVVMQSGSPSFARTTKTMTTTMASAGSTMSQLVDSNNSNNSASEGLPENTSRSIETNNIVDAANSL